MDITYLIVAAIILISGILCLSYFINDDLGVSIGTLVTISSLFMFLFGVAVDTGGFVEYKVEKEMVAELLTSTYIESLYIAHGKMNFLVTKFDGKNPANELSFIADVVIVEKKNVYGSVIKISRELRNIRTEK